MKGLSSSKIGFIEAVAAFSLGGSTVIAARFLTTQLPLFTTCFISMAAGLILLLPLQWRRRQELAGLTLRDVGFILSQGLVGMLLFRVFTLLGLRYTTAVSAGIITSTSPAMMVILSIVLLREKPSRKILGATLMAITGLVIINLKQTGEADASLLGNLLIFLAVLCECGMTLIRKAHKKQISTLTNTTVLILCSMALSLPAALFEMPSFSLAEVSRRDWVILFYYGFFPSATGYLLWGDGVVRIPGSVAGITMTAAPVTVLILSVTLLHESIDPPQIIGGTLALLAIILSNVKFPSKKRGYSKRIPTPKQSVPRYDTPEQ